MDSVQSFQNDTVRTDSSRFVVPGDTLPDLSVSDEDSLFSRNDTTVTWETVNSADTIVNYIAKDSIVYDLSAKRMRMYNDADINYGTLGIQAMRVTIDWDAGTMHGVGVPDTATEGTGKMIGTPVFTEGGEEYTGEEMTYNFKTKRGVIRQGKTTIDDGYYLGERIKRMSDDVYFIKDGQYTTCDREDHKHFYFGSPQMKVIPNDLIVAENITFYVEDIPLLWIPFAIIPSSGGRRSGIIVPSFGEDAYRGRYLTNGGYYFAMSDYWDLTLTGDWYWKGGYRANANVRYALRYNFTGSIDASYGRQTFDIGNPYVPDDEPRTDYSIKLVHNQTIDPTTQIAVDFNFISQGYYNRYSTNIDQLVSQTANSRATLSKRWEGTSRSATIAIARTQNIQTDASSTTLPDISFNQSQIFPFRASGSAGEAWYEQIGFNYSARFLNKVDVLMQTVDTSQILNTYQRRGINHSINFILNPKLGYFTVSPSLSYRERWYDHRLQRYYDESDSTVKAADMSSFNAIRTFSAGVNVSTKLYGLFRPNIWGIQGIRHTIQPTVGYSYNPDFSDPFWGYYDSYQDSTGQFIRYDPYTGYGNMPAEVFSGVGSGESQSVNMSLANVFEMKLDPDAADTTGEAKRVKLLNLNASASYNFAADSVKLSQINLSYNTSIGSLLDVSGSASFTPYVYERQRKYYDEEGNLERTVYGHTIDKFLWEDGQGLARLTSVTLNLRTSLNSDMFFEPPKPPDTTVANGLAPKPATRDAYDFRTKWQLGLGFNYNYQQLDPDNKSRSASLNASLSVDLTPHWKLSASTYYDVVQKKIGTPRINVTRDLHCWEMAFSWVPAGYYRQYNLVIRIKAPQLQDLKLERQGSDRGVY